MQTECPHCKTVFRLSEAELNQANHQVRCGHCLAVFNADNPYNIATYPQEADSSIDLNKPGLTANATDDIDDERPVIADVIPPELRAETRNKNHRIPYLNPILLSIGVLLSLFAGVFQYAYYNREALVKDPGLSPWLEKMCQYSGCTLPPPRDLSRIVLSSKNIFTHPNTENALMVTATIVNQASFAQDFPIMELRFENIRGKTIAGRRFIAEEYLDIPKEQIPQMQPDTPVSINLEIKDPGNQMVSYEFSFL